ncbi:MAG: hypothetical protein IJ637_03370 [Prevotella sp.]|nr:hypothetical protein [Prevotella sp.]
MKRILLSLPLLIGQPAQSTAQNDTLVVNHPKKVTIISSDSLQRVIVDGRQGDDNFAYQNTIRLVDANYESSTSIGRDHWELIPAVKVGKKKVSEQHNGNQHTRSYQAHNQVTAHLGVGFTCPTHTDKRMDISTFRSWEFIVNVLQWDHFFDRREHNKLSMGLGIDWRNYRMTDDVYFTKSPSGNVVVDRFPMSYEPDFSRIQVFALTATLRYEYDFGDGFAIGFGPVFNYNTYASIKTKYKLLGEKYKRTEKNIGQRLITIDWMLNMRVAGFPFYVKYSNDNVLKDGGVHFRSLSFGLYL